MYYTDNFMAISNAWRRSNGQDITIGFTDTGIDPGQPQLTYEFAASGTPSYGRTSRYLDWRGNPDQSAWADKCGHGTRIAQAAAGPNDGKNSVGVAWKSNLVMVRHDFDVFADPFYPGGVSDAYQAGQAISRAGENGAKIIAMAWGAAESSPYISDIIDSWHYGANQVLFVGAAGTSGCDLYLDWLKDEIPFPARKGEVVAVTGVDYYGQPSCESHRGPKVELAAHVYQITAGARTLGHADVVTMDGSSNATGTIAGVAALIWSRYRWMSRDQVRSRLHQSSSYYPNRDSRIGYGVINAHRALGGMWYASIGCGNKTDCKFLYKLASCTTQYYSVSYKGGDGPYSFRWSTGSTSSSTSLTLCPTAGRTEYYGISVTVTDNSDGTSLYRNARLEVVSSDPDGACPTCPV
jgi:subtilisin family serine protease